MKKITIVWVFGFLMAAVFCVEAGKGGQNKKKKKPAQQETSFDAIIAQAQAMNAQEAAEDKQHIAMAFEKWHALKYILHVSGPDRVDSGVFASIDPDNTQTKDQFKRELEDMACALEYINSHIHGLFNAIDYNVAYRKQFDLRNQILEEAKEYGIDFDTYFNKKDHNETLRICALKLETLYVPRGPGDNVPKTDAASQKKRYALQKMLSNTGSLAKDAAYIKRILSINIDEDIVYVDAVLLHARMQEEASEFLRAWTKEIPKAADTLFNNIKSYVVEQGGHDLELKNIVREFHEQCTQMQEAVTHDYAQLYAIPEYPAQKEKQATDKKVDAAKESSSNQNKNRKRRKQKKKQKRLQQDQEQQDAADAGVVAELAHQAHDAVKTKQSKIDQEFAQMALASGFGSRGDTQKNGVEHKRKKAEYSEIARKKNQPEQKKQLNESPVTALISDFEDVLPYDALHPRVSSWFDDPDDMLMKDAYRDLPDDEQRAAVQRHVFPSKVDTYIKKLGIRGFIAGGGISYNIPGMLIRGNETEDGVFSWGINNRECYHRCFSRDNQTVSQNVQDLIQRRTDLAATFMKQDILRGSASEWKSNSCLVKATDTVIAVIDQESDMKAVLYKPLSDA